MGKRWTHDLLSLSHFELVESFRERTKEESKGEGVMVGSNRRKGGSTLTKSSLSLFFLLEDGTLWTMRYIEDL